MLRHYLFLILTVLSAPIHSEELEIGGLLLDNTISRQGREFFRQFSQLWQDLPNSEGINVQIKEQVIPRSGTKLTVNMNHRQVYVTYMGRRHQPIKDSVETAMFILIEVMAQSQFSEDNPDMAQDGW
ncbi:curli production assembly protein CsgE [Alteromonadaceae bacterium M269]|nr:curli production assembly protein CsgE [Alteromonadaceae bacterium M269]